jgi:hypothetical protein
VPAPVEKPGVRLAELVATLSLGTDLGMGQPRLSWSSSKRRTPRKTSRMMRSVQRSPTTSRARAIEQL